MMELPPETQFLFAHGKNTTDRIGHDLLKLIMERLASEPLEYNGRKCTVRVLQDPTETERGTRLMFDVLDPDDQYDHVEFCLYKTGFGGAAAKEGG